MPGYILRLKLALKTSVQDRSALTWSWTSIGETEHEPSNAARLAILLASRFKHLYYRLWDRSPLFRSRQED